MEEIWKDITNYEGLYQVSNLGRVKSLPRNTTKGRLLSPNSNGKGYLTVYLSKEGKKRRFYIHKLVATAFLQNQENLPEVDHVNGNRSDNRSSNLQWISHVENLRKKETGIMIPKRVVCLETGEIFETVTAAAKAVNRSPKTMSAHLMGRSKTCADLHFEYYEED